MTVPQDTQNPFPAATSYSITVPPQSPQTVYESVGTREVYKTVDMLTIFLNVTNQKR